MTERVRRMILALFVMGVAGTGAELLLTGHVEDAWQKVPVALLAASLPLAVLVAFRPAGWAVLLFRLLMVLFVAAGALGTYFHYQGNAEFAVELSPGLSGFALLAEAFTRKTPPPLAPGTMIMLGLLGMVAGYGKNTEDRRQNE